MEQRQDRNNRLLRLLGGALVGFAALVMLASICVIALYSLVRVTMGLLMIVLVCVPLTFGTVLLVRTEESLEARKRVVRGVVWTLFAFYLAALVLALIVSRIDFREYPAQVAYYRDNFDLMTNFVPFETVLLYLRALKYNYIGSAIPLANLIGNVALFMPMALFLPCLFASLRKAWRFILLMSAVLLAVEALQLALCCGSCDVDDVILNLAGTVAVYYLIRIPALKRLLNRLYLLPALAEPDSSDKAENAKQDALA